MKRTLSFLLACLLVMGMLPTHVHAQETEPVVMETTMTETQATEEPTVSVEICESVETETPTEETAVPSENILETVETADVTEEIVEDDSVLEESLLLGLRWPDEWNKQKVSESEPNDFFTADFYGTDYSPNWIYSGDTVVGTIGLGCYPDDTWDYFEFSVSEASTVEIVAITRYSDMTTISGTSISYSAFEMELEKENADGRGYTTVASDSTGTYFYYTSSYQYYFSITASVQPGTYRLKLTEPKCTGSKQYNQYMCHLSVKGCEHSYKAEITPPTCIAEGYTTYTCRHCGKSYRDNYTSTIGHRGVTVTGKAATCTEAGLTDGVTCSVCGFVVKKQETIPAAGHSYGDWEVTKEATCTTTGTSTRTCTICRGTATQIIPLKPHSYGGWVVTTEPTCTKTGVKTQTCSVCGNQKTESVPITDHSYKWQVTQKATCEKDGKKIGTCTGCGKQVSETIPGGHSFQGGLYLRKAPTATAEGQWDGWCRNCQQYIDGTYPKLDASQTEYIIEDGIIEISHSSFKGNTQLTKIIIPDSVEEISQSAFSGCTGLTSITIPDSVTRIESRAFENCTALTSVKFPDAVNELYTDRLFYYCTSLQNVTLPKGCKEIGEYAFTGCESLTAITIPEDVTGIGFNAFAGCSKLKEVHISDLGSWCNISYLSNESHPFNAMNTKGNLYLNGELVTNCIIPEGVTSIAAMAFYNCDSLTSVTFPDSLTSIGATAFDGCRNLKEAHVSSLETWCKISYANEESHPFEGRGGNLYINGTLLTDCEIPEGITRIGDYAFFDCRSITTVTIPDSVTSIGDSAFRRCSNLASVELSRSITSIGNSVFNSCSKITSITIPDGVTSIGNEAFLGCESLSNITLPDSLTKIGDYVFFGCDGLSRIILPANVTSIGYSAFRMCDNLSNVILSDSLTSIGNQAFYDCKKLKSITIPANLTSFGFEVFGHSYGGLSGLNTIYFMGDAPVFKGEIFSMGTERVIYYPAGNETWTESVRKQAEPWGGAKWNPCEHAIENGVCPTPNACKNCGAPVGYTHDYVDATCTKPITCIGCGATKGTALGHTEVLLEGKAATCTETGLTEGKQCRVCGTITQKQTKIPALGHSEVVMDAEEATCTESGLTEGRMCDVCKEILVKQEEVPGLGHDYVNRSCTRCGVEKYSITRISGKDRHDTAFKVANMMKEVLGVQKFDTILIASGVDSADALAGSYLAAVKGAPILLSRNNSHPRNLAYIQENLSENGIVYILGGTGAVSQEMENLLIQNNIRYERVKGADRFGTNLEILKKAGDIQSDEILVSTAYNFADSLSASATGKPILLVNSKRNTLNNAQKAYLAEITANSPKTFTIIGGAGAVSDELAAALSEFGAVTREKGTTREATSVRVAEVYFQNPDTVFLAYSRNFPDGLCGGPLAYAMKAPLLLVNKKQEDPATEYVANNGITSAYILGGTAAVSEESVEKIFP